MQLSSQDIQDNVQNNEEDEPHTEDSNSISAANSDNRRVSREDIELVQNLIERCLQLYMNKGEVVKTLSNRARIEPGFTTLVWQKLEEENSEFFRAYYIRLKLKKQILVFNHLLEHQHHMMKSPILHKVPLVSMPNGIHPIPVNNLPMGYPIFHPAQIPTSAQPNLNSVRCGLPSCHVVNGIPAPAGFQPVLINSGNEFPEFTEIFMDHRTSVEAPAAVPCSVVSTANDIVSPASVASSNHFTFIPAEMSDMGMDATALDPSFTSDVATVGGLPDYGSGPFRYPRSLSQPWNFSLSDLTADLTNLGDIGPPEDYSGSPFLRLDCDLLNSPEPDDTVEEYFADAINNGSCSQSYEEKS